MLVSPGFHPGAAARFLPEVRNANMVASARAHLGAEVRQGTLLTEPGAPRRSPGLYLALLAEVRPPLSGLAVAPPLAAAVRSMDVGAEPARSDRAPIRRRLIRPREDHALVGRPAVDEAAPLLALPVQGHDPDGGAGLLADLPFTRLALAPVGQEEAAALREGRLE